MESKEKAWIKALIYGKPGTGKTTFGVSAPKPLILLSERQGVVHVRAAAKRMGVAPVGVLYMAEIADYRAVLRSLVRGTVDPSAKSGPFVVKAEDGAEIFRSDEWPETVVLDSVTDACRLIDAQILIESPPKLGKDNLPVNSERYWSVLKDRCERLIRSFRDVDFNVLFLCLEDDKVMGEGDEAERKVGPSLPMRSLPDVVAAAVNVVGVMTRRVRQGVSEDGGRADAEIDHVVRTVGPQYMLTKPYRPLRDVEVANFSSWVERIRADIAGEAVEAPPVVARREAVAENAENAEASADGPSAAKETRKPKAGRPRFAQ